MYIHTYAHVHMEPVYAVAFVHMIAYLRVCGALCITCSQMGRHGYR